MRGFKFRANRQVMLNALRHMRPHWTKDMHQELNHLLGALTEKSEPSIIDLTARISGIISRTIIPRYSGRKTKPVSYSLVNCMWVNEERVEINIPLDPNLENWLKVSFSHTNKFGLECTVRYPFDAFAHMHEFAFHATTSPYMDEVEVDGFEMGPLKWCHINAACALHFAGIDWILFYDGWVLNEIKPKPFPAMNH